MKGSKARMSRYTESIIVGMRSPMPIGLFALVFWAIGAMPAAADTSGRAPVSAGERHCIELGQAGTAATKRPSGPAGAEERSAGMRVYIDPVTGEFAEPPAGAAHAPSAASSTSDAGLVEIPSPVPGGGVMVDLQGRFRRPLVATIDADGKMTIRHLPVCGTPTIKK